MWGGSQGPVKWSPSLISLKMSVFDVLYRRGTRAGVLCRGRIRGTPLWTEWQRDMTENITFPQLCWWEVKILTEPWKKKQLPISYNVQGTKIVFSVDICDKYMPFTTGTAPPSPGLKESCVDHWSEIHCVWIHRRKKNSHSLWRSMTPQIHMFYTGHWH